MLDAGDTKMSKRNSICLHRASTVKWEGDRLSHTCKMVSWIKSSPGEPLGAMELEAMEPNPTSFQ